MSNYIKEIDIIYDWANENSLMRLTDESSFGFPKDKNKAGYILELKRANSSDMEKEAKRALSQIDDKKYYIELEEYGVKDIVKIGYVFDGKKVISSY